MTNYADTPEVQEQFSLKTLVVVSEKYSKFYKEIGVVTYIFRHGLVKIEFLNTNINVDYACFPTAFLDIIDIPKPTEPK